MPSPNRRGFLTQSSAMAASAVAAGGLIGSQASAAAVAGEQPARVNYRLGTVTYNIAREWDVPTLLRVCREVGLAAVELRTTHKHGVEPTMSPAARKETRQRFADADIVLWGCGTTCEFHSPDKKVVQQNIDTCRRFCQLVSDLGGTGVKVRPNTLPANVPVPQTLRQIGTALQACGRAANDANVEIWVEVHGRGTAHPPHMHTIMQTANHPRVGVTWNSNPTDVVNGSISQYFKLLRPWIKSVHINELTSGYPYRELFQLLAQTGYDRYTLAEIQGMPDQPSAERFLRYYKMLWTELTRA